MDKMVRIDRMHHCHEDTVILLNNEVVDFTIKVVVKGRTCVLHLLISLIRVHVRGFMSHIDNPIFAHRLAGATPRPKGTTGHPEPASAFPEVALAPITPERDDGFCVDEGSDKISRFIVGGRAVGDDS
jgi:hypothetical protein